MLPLDVLENWSGLVSVVSGVAGVLSLVLSVHGRQSVRLLVGWAIAVLGSFTIAGAVATMVSRSVPLLSASSAVLGGIAACGLLLVGTGAGIVVRARGPHHRAWQAIARIMHGDMDPTKPTGRVGKTIQLDVISRRRRSRLQRLARRRSDKLVILTGPAGSGKTAGLRAIVAKVCKRAEKRPRRLALYVSVRVANLPPGGLMDDDLIKEHLAASVPQKAAELATYLEQASVRPPWLFVFDLEGELGPTQVEQYIEAVRSFVASRDDCAIVATRMSVAEKSVFEMAPLTPLQQRRLLAVTGRAYPEVLRRLRHDPRVSDIANSPLLLGLLGASLTSDELGSTRYRVLDEITATFLGGDSTVADVSQFAFLLIENPDGASLDKQVAESIVRTGLGRKTETGFEFVHVALHYHLAGKYLCRIAETMNITRLLGDVRWHPVVVAALRGRSDLLWRKVVEHVRAALTVDIGEMKHVVENAESLMGTGRLPTPGSFIWNPVSLSLLMLIRDGLIDGTTDQVSNAVMPEAEALVLTAIAAGANRDRADAIDLLHLTSLEVATAVAAYVIDLEDETGLTDRLVAQLAASAGIYQRMSGRRQMWLLRAAARPHRLHRTLDQFAHDVSASSLPGRMRWMLRIGQVMAVGVTLWMIRSAVKAPQLTNILAESIIAAFAVSFIVFSALLHSSRIAWIVRSCAIAIVAVALLLFAAGGIGTAVAFVGEVITARVGGAVESALLLWVFTWSPAMIAYAAVAPSDAAARLFWFPQLQVMRVPVARPILDKVGRAVRRARSTPVRALFLSLALCGIVAVSVVSQLWSDSNVGDSFWVGIVLVSVIAGIIAARPVGSGVDYVHPILNREPIVDPLDAFKLGDGVDAIGEALWRISESDESLRAHESLLLELDSVLEFIKEVLPGQMDEPIKLTVWRLMPSEQVSGLRSLLREYDSRNPGKLTMAAHSSKTRQEINRLRGRVRLN